MPSPNPMSQWKKTALVAEAVICFAPVTMLLVVGAFMVPLQITALMAEPLFAEGPIYLILSVTAGFVGIGALSFVLRKLLEGGSIERPIPVLAAVLLGVTALVPMVAGDSAGLRLVALLPLLATAHILFLSRHLFVPLMKPTGTPLRSSGIWLVLPMLLVGLGLVARPENNLSRADLEANRATWLAERPAAYSYHLQIAGWRDRDLLYPRRIDVRGNQVISATYTFNRGPGDTLTYPPPAASAWTMDTVFDELIKARAQGAKVRARFNKRWGYVERADIEPRTPDSDWDLEAKDFEPRVEAPQAAPAAENGTAAGKR